ncbi:MAG: hypothetical protein K0R39_1398 [Symbiobacteriaceae bacterium]|jgi:hypothetical protein|nr:hypothetical protein [Symbiobacteriaceae bacterium]
MTDKPKYEPTKVEVQKVETVFDKSGGSRRLPPWVTINRYGRAYTNVEGGLEWRAFFVDRGVDPNQPWITTGTNALQGLILMYAAQATDPGAIEVKLDAANQTYSTHFGAATKQCPNVRPTTTVEARWKPILDKDGKPCLAINVTAASPKRKGAANPEEMAARAEEEAAKKAAKEAARKRTAVAKQGKSAKGGAPAPEAPKETPPTSHEE